MQAEELVKKYSSRKDLIPALEEIQRNYGYISEENATLLARQMKIPLSDISAVATFYNMFRLKPIGKYHISVCRGTACHVQGSESLLKHLESELQIKAGEITSDGLFSLEAVNCIGACAKAPAMMINQTVHGQLDEKKIKHIIDSIRSDETDSKHS